MKSEKMLGWVRPIQQVDLDFHTRERSEVLKVKLCTYTNDITSKAYYYICQCSSEDFAPVCEDCAKICHLSHNPTMKIYGSYICGCGKNNHIITDEAIQKYDQKKLTIQNLCFIPKFLEFSLNRGCYYHVEDDTIICSMCVEFCHGKDPLSKDMRRQVVIGDKMTCQCRKHYDFNAINLNMDLLSKKDYERHFLNFNMNILMKIEISRDIFFKYLKEKLIRFNNRKSASYSTYSFGFFSNFINMKILSFLYEFYKVTKNPFFKYGHFLSSVNNLALVQLMGFTERPSSITNEIVVEFFSAKFFYADFIFQYIIKTFFLKFNNMFSMSAILNMNLFQRYVYILQCKDFYNFSYYESEENLKALKNIGELFHDYCTGIMDLFENASSAHFLSFIDPIMKVVFPIFNKIVLFLIKYNLLSKDLETKYYSLLSNVFKIISSKQLNTFYNSELYILKAILYSLIYRSDYVFIRRLRDEKEEEDLYNFQSTAETDFLGKIFLSIVSKFKNEEKKLENKLKWDLVVRYILEIFLGKNAFLLNSVSNMETNSYTHMIAIRANDEVDILNKIKTLLNYDLFSNLQKLTNNLDKINNNFIDYEINYEVYIKSLNDYFTELKQFVVKKINFLPDLSQKYHIFLNLDAIDAGTNKKILDIQECVKYTRFFHQIKLFINSYAKAKVFYDPVKEDLDFEYKTIQNELLKMLIHFLFLLINKNYENLSLVMDFNFKDFANVFLDVRENYFQFLELISEMVWNNQVKYKMDNFTFITNTINWFLLNMTLKEESSEGEIITFLDTFEKILKIFKKSLKHISIENSELHSTLEMVMEKMRLLNENEIVKKMLIDELKPPSLVDLEPNINLVEDISLKRSNTQINQNIIQKFITQYLGFINEMTVYDFYFMGYIKNSDFIFDKKLLESHISSNTIKIEIYIEIIKNIQILNFNNNFRLDTLNLRINNIYMRNIPKEVNNTSFLHIYNEQKDDFSKFNIKFKLILKLLKNFDSVISKINTEINSVISKKVLLVSYYEFGIVRPLYSLINYYLLMAQMVKGKECYDIYNLIYLFFKVTKVLYDKLNKFNFKEDDKFDFELSQKGVIFDFEGFIVKHDLSVTEQKILDYNYLQLANNTVKYFEIDKIFECFRLVIKTVVKIADKHYEEEGGESDKIFETEFEQFERQLTKDSKKLDSIDDKRIKKTKIKAIEVTKLILENQSNFINETKKVVEDFYKTQDECYKQDISLIKLMNLTDSIDEQEFPSNVFSHLLSKFSSTLTNYNKQFVNDHDVEEQDKIRIQDMSLEKFYFQNFYTIYYLNILLKHAPEKFQTLFKDVMEKEDCSSFFIFISKYFIFGNMLMEVKKIYELDSYMTGKHLLLKSYTFDIFENSVNFFKNLCEQHNKFFQNQLFELDLSSIIEESSYRPNNSFAKIINLEPKPKPKRDTDSNKSKLTGKSKPTISLKKTEEGNLIQTILEREKEENEKEHRQTLDLDKEGKGTTQAVVAETDFMKHKREELIWLEKAKFNFLNFLNNCQHCLISNINLDEKKIIYTIKEIKNTQNIITAYNIMSILQIELIQGTDLKNFDMFYKNVSPEKSIIDEHGFNVYAKTIGSFIFAKHLFEVRRILANKKLIFNESALTFLYHTFRTINSLINQDLSDKTIIKLCLSIFKIKNLIERIPNYLLGIYINHILKLEYGTKEFIRKFNEMTMTEKDFQNFESAYYLNSNIYEDQYFKVCCEIYLFVTIIGEKYKVAEAIRVLSKNQIELGILKPHDLFASIQFLCKIITSCEFMIDSIQTLEDDLSLKKIYFIVNPQTCLISQQNIDTFFDNVDRSAPSTKLKALIEYLNIFVFEIQYKEEVLKERPDKAWMFNFNFYYLDVFNLIIATITNTYLLFMITSLGDNDQFHVYLVARIISVFQILANLASLILFLNSKYFFYVALTYNNINNLDDLSFFDKLNIYLWDCLMANSEVDFVCFNLIIGIIANLTNKSTFLYPMQLLTLQKFIPTIKEILHAIKLRFNQVIELIGFMAIWLLVQSSIEFYFIPEDYISETGSGIQMNFCNSMFECFLTFMNIGIRGGFGDILTQQPYTNPHKYWARYAADMSFFIMIGLLVLNMVNGVVIGAFSGIREEREAKEEDIETRCFICSIEAEQFIKKKSLLSIHQEVEHNCNNYFKFLLNIKMQKAQNLDSDQTQILHCLDNLDIKCFPVLRCSSIGDFNETGGEDED